MSAIFGSVVLTGPAAQEDVLSQLQSAHEYWSPDDAGRWVTETAGLGHLMSWNTPESKSEKQPLVRNGERAPLGIVADLRLDNREALYQVLASKSAFEGRALHEVGDAELVLLSYQKWGSQCPEHLLGDFAFAIWDESRRRLFCARDHLGVKSLYYRREPRRFLFSNDIRALAGSDLFKPAVNRSSLAAFLLEGEFLDPEDTFVDGIRRLPPASSLLLDDESFSIRTFWNPEDTPRLPAALRPSA